MSKSLLYFIIFSALSFCIESDAAEFKKGKDFWEMAQVESIPVATDDNLYFTWLGCDSCRKLETELANELDDFEVVPLIARQNWRPAAKAFYVVKMLDGEPNAWLKIKQQVDEGTLDATDQKALFAAIIELGYDKEAVAELLEDRLLYQRIDQAEALAKNYAIQYAPTVVVKGQYATDARHTMTINKFRQVLNYLKSL
jgi:thiol:disulfide interchange protein DsbA